MNKTIWDYIDVFYKKHPFWFILLLAISPALLIVIADSDFKKENI